MTEQFTSPTDHPSGDPTMKINPMDHMKQTIHDFPSPPRAWAEVNLNHLKHNLSVARDISGGQMMAVLKAGAYGHGITEIAHALDHEGLTFFGVASVIEARRLLHAGISTRIYILGPTFAEEREEIVKHRWTACVSSIKEAQHFSDLNEGKERLPMHITVDTGMGRGGFLPHQIAQALPLLLTMPNIKLEGIGSHLPSADEDREFTLTQFANFESIVQSVKTYQSFDVIHLANSAGLLNYTSKITNLFRPGLMLYGISPIPDFQEKLKPVMSLKSRITLIRTMPAGHGISYGRSSVLTKDTRVATIGIGYGDGYPRAVSGNEAEVIIRGIKCPLLGRVTMDQIMVDVTELPECEVGDIVELFGEHILVSSVASQAHTIAWEVLTGITPRVIRIYV